MAVAELPSARSLAVLGSPILFDPDQGPANGRGVSETLVCASKIDEVQICGRMAERSNRSRTH